MISQFFDDERVQVIGLLVLLALAPPFLTVVPGLPNVLGSGYYGQIFDDILLFALLGVALNVVFGHTDQLFLFLGGLAGASAYTTTYLADSFGITPWATLIVGVALAAAIGAMVSWISAKRKFNVILISILTLALQLALTEMFVGLRDITGGTTGRPFPGLGLDVVGAPLGLRNEMVLYYLLLVALLVVLFGYIRLIDSKFGLAFDTIREDDLAAQSIGVDVVWYKTMAGLMSAALIGFVGVMLAQRHQFILPSQFSFATVDVTILILLIIGGLRTTLGPVVGAIIIRVLEEALLLEFGEWRTAIFGALLILLFLYFREGVIPETRERVAEWRADDESGGSPG
ncbi:MAG: branched-chain amino acid ABC transporter permease [Haloferacaceae archaeon]